MSWLKETFGVEKPIIGMCHLLALPGDPDFQQNGGFEKILDHCRHDLQALQAGGIDAIMFSNEGSLPYLTEVEPITTISMARIIGQMLDQIEVPFGVNVLWDPQASIELAVATGAKFVREIFTGTYASDFGLWNTTVGQAVRHLDRLGGTNVRLLFNIVPESAAYLAPREIEDIARSTVFNARPDALCVSGLTAGSETPLSVLKKVKQAVPETLVFANTGVRIDNVEEQLLIADGAVVGTTFKRDGSTWNPVDEERVRQFMNVVKDLRNSGALSG